MLATGCDDLIKPKEICVQSSEKNLGCDDPRKGKKDRQYTRSIQSGDICTNQTDYFEGEKEMITIIKELKSIKYDLKKCKSKLNR